jgi:large subunit ribosomal protein L17
MRKRKKGRKLSRERNQRNALKKALLCALFSRGKIKTTEAKAKEIAPLAEKYLTLAKEGSLSTRRTLSRLFGPALVKKIVDTIAPRYREKKGGYTRIVKLGPRKKDGAKMAFIELIQ